MAKMRQHTEVSADIIIVGANHSGLSLAASLGAAGLNVVCLERAAPPTPKRAAFDGRTLALSYRSMQVLKGGGVWPFIEKDACPILDIRVADQDSQLYLDFHHQEVGQNPFGWIIENTLFNRALVKRVAQLKSVRIVYNATVESLNYDASFACVTLEDGRMFRASLIIGADGRKSRCRELAGIDVYGWDYHQTAIVCTIAHSLPHHNVAIEHFETGGPFATLPLTKQRSSIVWTERTETAATLMQLNESEFTAHLQAKVQTYLGTIKLVGKRFSHPLTLQHAKYYTAQRLALVGDAAHGIHPIAGQGFNLGMGDIQVLVDEIVRAGRLGLDLGDPLLLRRYEKRRKRDNSNMVLMTDLLVRLFSNAIPPIHAVRSLGLGAVQRLPRLRRFFMRTAMGLSA